MKKVLSVALLAVLIAILVSGTLAYFTAEDTVTNTFTIGSIEIEIVEEFEKPENMIPVLVVDKSDPNYIDKLARVKNTGKNDAYVQMYVAIPKELDDVKAFVVVPSGATTWTDSVLVGTATIGTVQYNVYRYRYKGILAVGAETENVITAAYLAPQLDYDHEINRFVMDGVTITDYIPGQSIDIFVGAQAIQAAGFADSDNALNTFTTHPWANQ